MNVHLIQILCIHVNKTFKVIDCLSTRLSFLERNSLFSNNNCVEFPDMTLAAESLSVKWIASKQLNLKTRPDTTHTFPPLPRVIGQPASTDIA